MEKPVRLRRHVSGSAPMRRITKAEAELMHADLRKWRAPSELRDRLAKLALPHGFFSVSQRAMQPWREAHCALAFAEALEADALRLGEDPPDFYLLRNGQQYSCELVEVRSPGARIGLDFDNLASLHNRGASIPVEHFDPAEGVKALSEWLGAAIASKAKKSYPPSTILAIRAHIMWLPSLGEAIRDAAYVAVSPFLTRFRAIWVADSHRVYAFQDARHQRIASDERLVERTLTSWREKP